jgi:ssDNA-binding Zn-finger/Zn-ribbon topoisomerase 1
MEEKMMMPQPNYKPNPQRRKEPGKKYPQNNNRQKAKGPPKKPADLVPLYIMVKCKKCGKALGSWMNSSGEFLKFIYGKGWKNVNFIKRETNENVLAKDIKGVCCPECQKEIGEWKKGNFPHKNVEDTATP